MSLVPLVCFFAASLFSAEAVAIKANGEVVVGADARQMMRKHTTKAAPAKHTAPEPKKQLSISLYYETKCPDCVEFINNTLAPLWRDPDIKAHLNITMNPYGNAMSLPIANVSQGYKFWHPKTTNEEDGWKYVHLCQHGTDECLGNLIQACAINAVEKLPDYLYEAERDKYMELVFCMAGKPDWSMEKASYECMTQADIDPTHVKECVNSTQGNQLFAEFGKQTGAVPGRLGTPWVMINGTSLENVTDLMRTVCYHIGDGPSSCAPFKNQPPPGSDPGGSDESEDDGDFTVLPALKKATITKTATPAFKKAKVAKPASSGCQPGNPCFTGCSGSGCKGKALAALNPKHI